MEQILNYQIVLVSFELLLQAKIENVLKIG